MKKTNLIFLPLLLFAAYFVFSSKSGGAAFTNLGNRTGSPGSSSTCAACHSGGSFSAAVTASLTDLNNNVVTSYTAGDTLLLNVTVTGTGASGYGYQAVMMNSSNTNAGQFDLALTSNTRVVLKNSFYYSEQSSTSSTGVFQTRWVAPTTAGTGTVTLYYVGNCVNGNFTTSGDQAVTGTSISLTENLVLTASATSTSTLCSASADGSAIGFAANGIAPYTFDWSNGVNSGSITADSHLISNLVAGSYSFTVTDGNGDTSSATVFVDSATAITAAVSSTSESCFGLSDGAVSVAVSGGAPPYSYLWSNGATTAAINGLMPGSYTVTITDANGCTQTSQGQVAGASQINITANVTSPSCVNEQDGAIAITVVGGVAPYSYLWSNGATTSTISNLWVGSYMVTVTDANGCDMSTSLAVISLNMPPAVGLTVTDANCATASNGAVATAVTGNGPYTYNWSNGMSTADISAVIPGNYTLTTTDANGCSDTSNTTVANLNLFPQVNLGVDTVICDTAFGQFTLSADGLPHNPTHLWSTNETTAQIVPPLANEYWVAVTDSFGCEAADTIQIGSMVCTTSVADLFVTEAVQMFPQPAHNQVVIETTLKTQMVVYALNGNQVLVQTLQAGKNVINISHLGKGTYLVQLQNAKGMGRKKLVVF